MSGKKAQTTGTSSPVATAPAPTQAELEELHGRVLRNMHQSDSMLEEFERTEHDHVRASGKGLSSKDTLSRIIPTGAGTARVELERNGKPSDAAVREQQWHRVAQMLESNTRINDPAVKREHERAARRRRERAEMVEAAGHAFRFQFVGRSMDSQGRMLLESSFEPDPGFHSSVRFSGVFRHIRGHVWVDEAAAQIVRLEAELFEDVNIAAGVVARVYRGSHITLEQQEVQPGIWLPKRINYDLQGRLLLFPATYHEQIDDSSYLRILPEETLLRILQEHPSRPGERPLGQPEPAN